MAIGNWFLGLVAAVFFLPPSLAQADPYTPQIVELDLVFPRNDTYGPLDHFPLLWGLQNAQSAWEMGMMFSWDLQQLDLSYERRSEQGVFPNHNYTGQWTTYTQYGNAPSDPYFLYYFPDSLYNLTEGHWKLSWKFGFHIDCVNGSETTKNHFDHQPSKEMVFRVAGSGQTVDLLSLGNSTSTCSDQSITFRIMDYVRALWTSSDNCPILAASAPAAKPCALHFNETLIEEMDAGAATGCSSATVTSNENWCKKSAAPRLLSGGRVLVLAVSLSILSMFL